MINIKERPVLRITVAALCLALYVVLSSFCPETPFLKLTFDSIPLILVSVVSGPIDGILVAVCGCVINDAVTGYLNFMTPVWMIPAVARAAIIGFIFLNKDILKHKTLWIITVVASALLVTGINTGVMFLDGYVWGYPVTLTFLLVLIRIGAGLITSAINIFLIPTLVEALKKAGFLRDKEEKKTI